MAAPNLPILYQNIMDGLPSDFARDVFLWAVERPGEGPMCYRAEAFAREAGALVKGVTHLIDLSQWCQFKAAGAGRPSLLMSDDQRKDLVAFIMTRHANLRFGANQSPTYARAG